MALILHSISLPAVASVSTRNALTSQVLVQAAALAAKSSTLPYLQISSRAAILGSFLKLFAFMVVYCYRPKARELNLIDYASSVFSLFVIQSLTGGLDYALVVR